ncbi:MAG: DUF5123 domain-containing protein [Bacteroidales bacterium]|nr:DUF5123 domain-containing protein [Bacteroidales bacterium]MCM1146949.1 DUF5123 domain-containing protein [Bacteroidales bacterium]MCM1207004.1 DUF5123 domain-containing protein [Bacillota bacterium]MCM1511392.1 DUF5123 domain-containing protein [Clostridium sp.]
MKSLKTITLAASLLLAGVSFTACTDDNDWSVDSAFDRLFGVSDKISVVPGTTDAELTFQRVPDAKYYIVEVSTLPLSDEIPLHGTESSIVYGEDGSITKAPYIMKGLNGDTQYYLRIKSMSENKAESKWVYYKDGETFKTLAEQIFNDPVASDRKENSLRVSWPANSEVTHLVISYMEGEEQISQEIILDDNAKAAGEYTITGLTPSTAYTIVIMNGEAKRGTLNLSTAAAMPEGDYKIELPSTVTRITGALLQDILAQAQAETGLATPAITIGLTPDMTYDVASISEETGEDSNLKLPDGVAFTFFGMGGGEPAVLNWKKSLDLVGGHAYIRFENLTIQDGGCQYLINQSTATAIGQLTFTQCNIKDFNRSLLRTQSGNVTIDEIVVDGCILTNMSWGNGYSVFYVGDSNTKISKLTLSNSTFDISQRSFIEATKAGIGNIYINDCTFYKNVASGRYLIDANGQKTNIEFNNTILGMSYDYKAADESSTSRGIRTGGTALYNGCLRTADCVYGSNDIKDLEKSSYKSADIFTDPDNHNFTLKISQKVGDPRWYSAN